MEGKILAVLGVTVVMSCLFAVLTDGAQKKEEILITSFEEEDELEKIGFYFTEGERVSTFASDGKYGLKVEFKSECDWPGFSLFPERLGFPEDWSRFNTILMDVYNPEEKAIVFSVSVKDIFYMTRKTHPPHWVASFVVPAESRGTFGFIVEPPPFPELLSKGKARGQFHELPDFVMGPSWFERPKEFDVSRIKRIFILLARPKENRTLYFDNIRLISAVPIKLEGMIDRFGQYNYSNWKGKVHSEEDLIKQKKRRRTTFEKTILTER